MLWVKAGNQGGVMIINNDFEISYLLLVFALLGVILIGNLLSALHLQKLHPTLIGAALGALLGFALIEAMPLVT
jgi:hypothetical protein